jgi:hypothetical protein
MTEFRDKAELHQHLLKQDCLIFDVTVKANATPALKLHISDIPNVAVLKTQGKSADADAIEVYTASPSLADATGVINVLIDEKVDKIYEARVVAASAGTATVSAVKSAGERIILNIDSNQDLTTTDLTLTLEVKCKLK